MGPARIWSAITTAALTLAFGASSAPASQITVKDATITTQVDVDLRCDYPDIDPCDDNEGGWKGQSLRANQHSSATFALIRDVHADTGGLTLPVTPKAVEHSSTNTLVQTTDYCTRPPPGRVPAVTVRGAVARDRPRCGPERRFPHRAPIAAGGAFGFAARTVSVTAIVGDGRRSAVATTRVRST
jgi:hypothetical protein